MTIQPRWPLVDYDRGEHVDLTGHSDLARRTVLEEHLHEVREDETDDWKVLPVRAVYIDSAGPAIEVGPYSVTPGEARLLATSLTVLANMLDHGQGEAAPPDATDWPRGGAR